MLRPPSTNSSAAKSWAMFVLFIAGVSALVAFLMWKFSDVSFLLAFVGIFAVFFGVLAYILGEFYLYETACRGLGWSCTTGPQEKPQGFVGNVNITICGNFRGRPFALYRVSTSAPGTRGETSSKVEWTGEDIRLPSFRLEVRNSFDAAADKGLGLSAMIGTVSGALGFAEEQTPIEFGSGSGLAGRAKLTATDAQAAHEFFTRTLCDRLDSLITIGSIEAGPGRLLIHGSGFPGPWKLMEYLARADQIRHILIE